MRRDGQQPRFAHGQPVYLQIPATDIVTSARFYERVLGWSVDPPQSGFEVPGLIGQWITDRVPAPDAGPVVWMHVDDVVQTLEAAQRAGAVVRDGPTPDGPRVLGSFSDPAGNLVGIAAHGARAPTTSPAPATGRADNRTMPASTVIPELVYDDVTEARRWLCDVFGLTERWHAGDHRAQLSFGTGTVAITEPRTSRALAGHVSLVIRVDDADAHCRRARERGATIIAEPRDHPYGERQYTAEDLGGHHWCFSQSIADVAPEDWGGTSGPALGPSASGPRISVMLIVPDADAAVAWYRNALGAEVLWDLGGVAGLEVGGAPFFLHQVNPDNPAEDSPGHVGQTSVRIEVFVDDPDSFVAHAVAGGATSGSPMTEHQMPWGTHRQGGFQDPFGHRWSVGDASPLRAQTA
ncbi:MAG: VOC family protein [Solirubrobacteraceae bacterium]